MKRFILVLALLPTLAFAQIGEKVKLKLNLNGAKCKHFQVVDLTGKVLLTGYEDKLFEPVAENDNLILKQLKLTVKKYKLTKAADIKVAVEKESLIIK